MTRKMKKKAIPKFSAQKQPFKQLPVSYLTRLRINNSVRQNGCSAKSRFSFHFDGCNWQATALRHVTFCRALFSLPRLALPTTVCNKQYDSQPPDPTPAPFSMLSFTTIVVLRLYAAGPQWVSSSDPDMFGVSWVKIRRPRVYTTQDNE